MKKVLLCLSLIVAIGLFAACGSSNDNDTDSSQQETSQTQDESVTPAPGGNLAGGGLDAINWDEHVTFTWWLLPPPPNDFYNTANDNAVVNYLEQRFNVTFSFEEPVIGTEGDALALMMGTGRYTDVIHLGVYPGSVTQLYDDGIIVNIAEWLEYMPNLQNIINTQPEIARGVFDDAGRILTLPEFAMGTGYPWAGFMYRHDILEAMTDGNVQFPSGNNSPSTIADWEYMLPLMQAYFQAAGFADYAPLIIPFSGTFHWGDLKSGFGANHTFYVRDGIVHAGITEPAMFEYVSTMRDWFERGWIHSDFASRTTDLFFMPNNPLVFGGAAGTFFGFEMHIGDRMSMPEFGMNFDVRAIPSPLAPGITHRDMMRRSEDTFGVVLGSAVYTGNNDIGRFLAIMDYFYSDDGSLTRTIGLRADQIPLGNTLMAAAEMTDGAWWRDESGNVVINPNIDDVGGHIARLAVNAGRMPGIYRRDVMNANLTEEAANARAVWGAQDETTEVHPLPPVLSPTVEEASTLAANDIHITDHINQTIAMFIMGTTPLNESTWNDFLNQLNSFGLEANRAIWQAAYDRYLMRGQ